MVTSVPSMKFLCLRPFPTEQLRCRKHWVLLVSMQPFTSSDTKHQRQNFAFAIAQWERTLTMCQGEVRTDDNADADTGRRQQTKHDCIRLFG